MSKPTHDYGVVVLYYRLGDRVFDTLEALSRQTSVPAQVVVVDNASGDGVLDELPARFPSARLVTLQENIGYSAAMNAGADALDLAPANVLFLTHEVLMRPECVRNLLAAFDTDPTLGMVGPALKLHGTDQAWSYGGIVDRFGEVRHITDAGAQQAEWLDGACLLARRHQLTSVGGFDTDYFLYWEDVDLSLRFARVGAIGCVPDAVAYQDTATAPIYFRTRNQILCWRKHRRHWFLAASSAKAFAKVAIDLGHGRHLYAFVRLRALLDGFTGNLSTNRNRMLRETMI
ncbi:glycosyltransferase family 2 protein [Tsukamurella sp. 8F]|uniref:glycosyltransferase n=1 Tax=unclassified Tsukamurella TaxID=2633480 RepID=UPI0023B89D39|nr:MULTISPECIES: glycosyltransferase family 2 protein [unclassified Tsukamurella]MDF0530655.1 glycosyltransferase family 2 protein [Tsukamurella sp. 8J]MDF0587856.1 glycosyltransferase family 2 protein [Tsukamurella sp. 8F]